MNAVDRFEKMPATFREGNMPLYFQFFLMIRNQILLGELEPGERIPTIDELNQIYQTSHATIRKAMALLAQARLITKKRGKGTMVREDADLLLLDRQTAQSRLPDLTRKIIFARWDDPPHRVIKVFQGQPEAFKNGLVFTVRLLLSSKEQPHYKRLVDSYIQKRVVDELGEAIFCDSDALQRDLLRLTDTEVKIDETIRPWICNAEMAELLEIEDGTPVFHGTWIMSHKDYHTFMVSEWVTTATSLVRSRSR